MTLILKRSLAGPGTHALVIGAGANEGQYRTNRHRMVDSATGQLVAWLATRYRNPSAELATIDVYHDSWIPGDLDHVPGYVDQYTASAGHQQIEAAAENWMRRAGSHEDNIALFYFAGRAFSHDGDTLLAFQDFKHAHWYRATSKSGVASLSSLIAAMRGCRARRQLYLLDIDRNENRSDLRSEDLVRLRPEISPPPHQAIVYSASPGQCSFHEVAAELVHPFVPLLTQFLDSRDAELTEGAITASRLAAGLTKQMEDLSRKLGVDQRIEFEIMGDFDFHHPMRPCSADGSQARHRSLAAPRQSVPPSTAGAEPRPDRTDRLPGLDRKRSGAVDSGSLAAWRAWIAKHRDTIVVQVLAGVIVLLIGAALAGVSGLGD